MAPIIVVFVYVILHKYFSDTEAFNGQIPIAWCDVIMMIDELTGTSLRSTDTG